MCVWGGGDEVGRWGVQSVLQYPPRFTVSNEMLLKIHLSSLVGALSPVNYKGLHQEWKQTSVHLKLHIPQAITPQISFSQTTTQIISTISAAFLYSAGTEHGYLHPAGWPISFCGPTLKPVLATPNTGRSSGEVSEKNAVEWTWR